MCAGLADGAGHGGIVLVAFGFDEEEVFPSARAAGAGFDEGHVDAFVAEGVEDFDEGAGPVCGSDEECGFVVAAGACGFGADDVEAGGVCGVVFDLCGDDLEAVEIGGGGAGDGGGVGLGGGEFCGSAGGGDGGGSVGEAGLGEPALALGKDFGFGVEDANAVEGAVGEEVVVDGFGEFGADFHLGVFEGVDGVDDASDGGVFDGDDAEVGVGAGDFFEDGADVGEGFVFDGAAELASGGLVGEGAWWAEEGDAEGAFEVEGAAHEFAVDGGDGSVGEGPGVECLYAAEDFLLAVGGVDGGVGGGLEAADLLDDAGAFVEEIDDSGVEVVDSAAEVVEIGHGSLVSVVVRVSRRRVRPMRRDTSAAGGGVMIADGGARWMPGVCGGWGVEREAR